MAVLTTGVAAQYSTSDKLAARARLHTQYSVSDEDVVLALTSYPPGEGAPHDQLAALRTAIDAAFARGNGVLEVDKEVGLFLSRKAG